MAFPVTGDLNRQTRVLKVPVITLQLKFVDKSKKPIPNYQFKTIYRGRTSETKKANVRGIATIKALAGQHLTLIDGEERATTTAIVTYGSKSWTIIIGKNILKEDVSKVSKSKEKAIPETSPVVRESKSTAKENATQTKIEKPKIKEVEKKTKNGPTLEVESDQTEVTIQFIDEKTNKPLSGVSYITKSVKYGKNTSVTGKDGTRGRPHGSLVGVEITVLVNEDGKEVKKDSFVANKDRDKPYVYKAKKPKRPNAQVLFNNVDRQSIVSQKSRLIIAELAEQCGMSKIYITSTLRTPEEQAKAMWGKKSLYGPIGRAVHDVGSRYNQYGEARRTQEMAKAIRSYLDQGKRTSNHCVTFEIYAKLNVVDLGNRSNGFVYYKNKKKYLTTLGKKFKVACDQAKEAGKIKKYIPGDGAEGAFHLEIAQ